MIECVLCALRSPLSFAPSCLLVRTLISAIGEHNRAGACFVWRTRIMLATEHEADYKSQMIERGLIDRD